VHHEHRTLAAGRAVLAAMLLSTAAAGASAAGGHFDVDDATMLAPGHCQVETWLIAGRSPALHVAHLGPACNFAGVEWGFNADRIRLDDLRADAWGPQAKWVTELVDKRLAMGGVLALTWRDGGPDRPLVTAYVPVTAWFGANQQLQVNLNLGADHDAQFGHFRRWGLGADWSATDRLTLTAERREALGQRLTRVGARWALTPLVSVDASIARAGETRVYALGLNWEWER